MNTLSHEEHDRLQALLDDLCNAKLDSAGQQELQLLLDGNHAAQVAYVRYVDLQAGIRNYTLDAADPDSVLYDALVAEAPHASNSRRLLSDLDEHQRAFSLGRGRTLAAVGTIAAALVVATFVAWQNSNTNNAGSPLVAQQSDAPLRLAKLHGAVGARWAGEQPVIVEGSYFVQGQQLELTEGLAEIIFASGARIVVQGPASIDIVDGQSIRLPEGRVAAYVPNELGPFYLDTGRTILTAANGEFGAEIDAYGSVEMRVYYGDVSLKVHGEFGPGRQLHLTGSEGARFDSNAGQLSTMLRPNHLHFVRFLPEAETTINLVDLVSGVTSSDEFVHSGISLADGTRVRNYADTVEDPGEYISTPSLRGVDGVFVPNGSKGPNQVDSIGRRFDQFPTTTGKSWSGAIMARRPSSEHNLSPMRIDFQDGIYGYVNWLHVASKAEELCPDNRGLIGIHANGGITFDLHAIRRQYPNHEALCFRALVGNLEAKPERYEAEAWVIIDGEQRYHRSGFSREDGPDLIEIPLHSKDRFLVLAATDSDGDTAFDWVTFGDAVVEMQLDRRRQTF